MTNPASRTKGGGAAKDINDGSLMVSQATDPFLSDTYAWTAIHLDDGRVVSLAWLRNYPNAIASIWRRYR